MSEPRIEDFEPSVKVTNGKKAGDNGVKNKLELPVMWIVVPKSMTHLVDDVRRHFVLPMSAVEAIGLEEDDTCNESWYIWNLANLSAEMATNFSVISLVEAI